MIRRATLAAALVLGAACLNTADPSGFIFRYQVGAYGCAATCDTIGATSIDSAARGDTVWVQHIVTLIGAVDSVTPQHATLRPDCAGRVAVLAGLTTVRSVPTPTCADSTYVESFTLAGTPIPSAFTYTTQWVVDSLLPPGVYSVKGRVMARPLVEPQFGFRVQ